MHGLPEFPCDQYVVDLSWDAVRAGVGVNVVGWFVKECVGEDKSMQGGPVLQPLSSSVVLLCESERADGVWVVVIVSRSDSSITIRPKYEVLCVTSGILSYVG